VKPTRPIALVGTTALALALSYLVLRFWDHFGTIPPVPLSAPITLAVLAVAVLGVALGLRARFAAHREARLRAATGRPAEPGSRPVKPIDPLQAARALVLAKASGLVGSIFGGLYGGYGLLLLGRLDVDIYRSRAITCGFAFLAGVALMLAALFLERVLRVPPEAPASAADKLASRA
jgi:Protein of unknown function (DUF3180)